MDILNSPVLAIAVVLVIFGVLGGFFRHFLVKVVAVLIVEVALFILFPNLMVYLAELVSAVRHALS
jgi:hypothetical protein